MRGLLPSVSFFLHLYTHRSHSRLHVYSATSSLLHYTTIHILVCLTTVPLLVSFITLQFTFVNMKKKRYVCARVSLSRAHILSLSLSLSTPFLLRGTACKPQTIQPRTMEASENQGINMCIPFPPPLTIPYEVNHSTPPILLLLTPTGTHPPPRPQSSPWRSSFPAGPAHRIGRWVGRWVGGKTTTQANHSSRTRPPTH